jgi:cytochrome c oxidase subunit 1
MNAAHATGHNTDHDAHHDDHHDHKPGFFMRWFCSTNHKDIGTLYIIFSILAGLIGGAFSMMMRAELQDPGMQFVADGHLWNVLVTAHGLIMVFFVVMPGLIGGFGNWFVPLMIGAPDMAFPRMNNISFWLLCRPSACCWLGSGRFRCGDRLDDLSAAVRPSVTRAPAVDLAIFSLHLAGASSILGAINFITTIFNMRAPGMTLHKMPLFAWSDAGDGVPAAAVAAGAGGRHHHAADRPQLRHCLLQSRWRR